MSAGVVIGDHAHLAHGNSFQDVDKVLKVTRLAVTWQAVGQQMGADATERMRETVAMGRALLGGNGIAASYDYEAAEIFAGAESVYSYEGTDEINTLVTGPVACLTCPMPFPSPPHALSTAPLRAGPR